MRVLHYNTDDWGGAAKSCIRLHNELKKENIESDILTLFMRNDNHRVHSFYNNGNPMRSLEGVIKSVSSPLINRINTFGRKFNDEMFSRPYSNIDLTEHPLYESADIIHLHWVAHYLDYKSFFRKNTKPVVWTFRDSNSFTGGCHVHLDCRGFENNCDACPQLDGNTFRNYAKNNITFKRKLFKADINLNIVTPSEWLKSESVKSGVFTNFNHYVIPNFADNNKFKPQDRMECRKKLELPADKNILLFLSSGVNKEYKGFPFLKQAIERMNDDILVLAAGGKINDKPNIRGFKDLGYIDSEEKLSIIYNASDVFVNPSLSESFSNTTLESLMCGTPVIGFNRTAIPELIIDNFNGILVEETTSDSLRDSIEKFFANKNHFDRTLVCDQIQKKYSIEISVGRYIELYKNVVAE